MEPVTHQDSQFSPTPLKPKRSNIMLWIAILVVFVVVVLLGVNMLQAEEKLIICNEPYVSGEECADTCGGECEAAQFANNKPVCFECAPKGEPIVIEEDKCPEGLTNSVQACNSTCNNGSCIEFNQVNNSSCYICVQCATGTFSSKESCDTTCSTECTVNAEKKGAKCYSC